VIRVALVDDHTLVRRGIRTLLEMVDDFTVVGEAGDADEATTLIRRARPDVVLLDVRLPHKSGLDVLHDLRATGELPPTILLTTFDDDEILMKGVKAGARGYLMKDVSFKQLTDAIRTVASGGSVIRPALTERILRRLEQLPRDFESLSPPDRLTQRELDVLRLVAAGYSNREIADALGASEGTIKNHTSSILSKLGVRDRTRAVLRAIELGVL